MQTKRVSPFGSKALASRCFDHPSSVFSFLHVHTYTIVKEWESLGAMITTTNDAMVKNRSRGEMVTPSFTGNMVGDPRGGRTRMLTNNVCSGTSYYLGVQANGSKFVDRDGGWRFGGEGEQGMIDWGAVAVNDTALADGETSTAALATALELVPGTCHAPYVHHRCNDTNESVYY